MTEEKGQRQERHARNNETARRRAEDCVVTQHE